MTSEVSSQFPDGATNVVLPPIPEEGVTAMVDKGEIAEPQDAYAMLQNEFRAACQLYDDQIEVGTSTAETRNAHDRALKLLRRRVANLIAEKGGQTKILNGDDDEGLNLISLLTSIDSSIAQIPIDARQQREQRESQFSQEQVSLIIDILRRFEQLRKNFPGVVTQLQRDTQDKSEVEKLDALYRNITEFNILFENLVGQLFDNQSHLIETIMNTQTPLDQGQLMAATSFVNMNTDRRQYCLSTIYQKIQGWKETVDSLTSQSRRRLSRYVDDLHQLETQARIAFR